MGSERWVRRFE